MKEFKEKRIKELEEKNRKEIKKSIKNEKNEYGKNYFKEVSIIEIKTIMNKKD